MKKIKKGVNQLKNDQTAQTIFLNYNIRKASENLINRQNDFKEIERLKKIAEGQEEEIDGMIGGGLNTNIKLKSYLVDGGVVVG